MTKGHISLHLWGHLRHEAVFSIFTMCNRRAAICFSISLLTCQMLIAKKTGSAAISDRGQQNEARAFQAVLVVQCAETFSLAQTRLQDMQRADKR